MKTEGEVDIANGRGREVEPVPDMKLYSGYRMETKEESYAWLNLDSMRLAKMDVSSQISIERKRKELEIFVDSGSLFFHIKEPLKEDETLDIRIGNMAVGIRGTCGWVEVLEGGDIMKVYLLEGKVLCETTDGGWDVVRPGEMAVMTEEGEIDVSDFTVEDIPDFVMKEIEEDEELIAEVLAASGLDVTDPTGGTDPTETDPAEEEVSAQSPLEEALEQYRAIVRSAESYRFGDEYTVPGREYGYVLVQMYARDQIPTLLIYQQDLSDPYGGVGNVRIFRYDPDTGTMYQPEESLRSGVASGGGFRGQVGVDGNGNGLLHMTWSSGSGDTDVDLVTIHENTLHIDRQWEGRLDRVPDQFRAQEVGWYDRNDPGGFDAWMPDGGDSFGLSSSGGASSPGETDGTQMALAETAAAEATAPTETIAPTEVALAETAAPTEIALAETAAPAETAPAETTAAAQDADGLAAYAGTYTPYSMYSSYSGGRSVTLGADGVVTGGETNGRTPASVTQNANGSISIIFSSYERYTLFPIGSSAKPDGSGYDASRINLEYLNTGGGAMNIIYYKS